MPAQTRPGKSKQRRATQGKVLGGGRGSFDSGSLGQADQRSGRCLGPSGTGIFALASLLERIEEDSSFGSKLVSAFFVTGLIAALASLGSLYRSGLAFPNTLGFWVALVLGIGIFNLRRHRLALALRWVVWGLWLLILAWGFLIAGVRTPALFALPLILALGGWLLSQREALLLFASSAVMLTVEALAEHWGWFHVRIQRDAISYWTTQLAVLGGASFLSLALNHCFLTYYQRIGDLTRELERRARIDSLTGLPNRAGIMEFLDAALSRASRNQCQIAVLFIDLDEFKAVNDTYGHAAGDHVLKVAAERLKESVRVTDEVARLGGDEFLAILTDLSDVQAVYQAVERILSSLDQTIVLEGGQEVRADASIGIALSPGDGNSAEVLLRHADTAMYEAKAHGRFTFSFYTEAMTQEAQRRHRVSTLLRRALERGEFRLWLQPRVDMAGGGLVGAEALLRWDSPELGFLSPGDFLPLAERGGVMLALGDWVLQRACGLWRELADKGLVLPQLAINVGPAQMGGESFIASLEAAMLAHRIPRGVLHIEISETGLLGLEKAAETLANLHQLGVGVAVDDFGAGMSSLKRLANLPLDVIKIDRSYASQLGSTEDGALITRIVIGLAETLGLEVVAEGVEQEGQSRLLLDCGCHIGQGYHFGKPMPAAEFLKLWIGPNPIPV